MSFSLLQSELGEWISPMPAAIKHEISIFIFTPCLSASRIFTQSLFDPWEPFFFFFYNLSLDPKDFISRKPEQSSLYFVGRHLTVDKKQQAFYLNFL